MAPTGGIRLPVRRRPRLVLTLTEPQEISRGIASDLSLQAIATRMGRAASTVSREVNRNSGLQHYRASRADEAARDRARRPKPCKLVSEPVLYRLVANKLRLHGSPEEIAGWLKRTCPEHEKCPGSGHSQLDPDQYPSTHQACFFSPIGEMSRREYISYDIYQMQHILPDSLFAVLANTTRLRSLILLFKHGELCVCDLTEVTGAAQPNISRNLAQMRDTGLLTDRRQGQWVYYQINPDVPAWVTDVLQAVASGTTDLNPYKNDDDVLAEMPTRPDSRRCS